MDGGSAVGHNSSRQWATFSNDIGDDPLRVHNSTAKQPAALLDPVELNELHPFNNNNEFVAPQPSVASPEAKSAEFGEKRKVGERSVNREESRSRTAEEIILTVAPTTSTSTTDSASPSRNNGGDKAMKNGELLTIVHPNSSDPFAWIRKPTYDASVMPSILTNKQNQLTLDVYSNMMRTIEKDARFASYTLLYSRMIPVWLIFSIIILLAVLASSPMGGLPVMIFGFVWLFMLLFGLLFCVLLQKYIVLALRSLVKELNNISQTYRLLVGIQDRGIIFIFYDFDGCREEVSRQLRVQLSSVPSADNSHSDIEIAHKSDGLMLEHAQAYVKALVKLRLRFPTRPSEGVSDYLPKHVAKSHCLCQFVSTEHFNKGPGRRSAPWYERLFAV